MIEVEECWLCTHPHLSEELLKAIVLLELLIRCSLSKSAYITVLVWLPWVVTILGINFILWHISLLIFHAIFQNLIIGLCRGNIFLFDLHSQRQYDSEYRFSGNHSWGECSCAQVLPCMLSIDIGVPSVRTECWTRWAFGLGFSYVG